MRLRIWWRKAPEPPAWLIEREDGERVELRADVEIRVPVKLIYNERKTRIKPNYPHAILEVQGELRCDDGSWIID